MVTIKEVAQRAGVGVGTVSRVLNDAPSVRPETRQRVQAAITALNYHPNHAARQLVTSRTMTLGVVLPFLTVPFFMTVLQGIEATVVPTGYYLNIFNVETPAARTHYFRELPYRGRVDGLIVVSLPLEDDEVARLVGAEIPTVLVDGVHPDLPSVQMQNATGAQMAIEHLIERGHQRIAFVSGPIETALGFPVNRERLAGYCAALTRHQLLIDINFQQAGEDSHAAGVEMGHHLLALPTPPTAIFACSDVHALGVLQAAQARGLRVPEDVAVVGYDDIELAAYVGLTTVRQPMAEMGRRGVELLLAHLNGHLQYRSSEVLTPTLIVRGTT